MIAGLDISTSVVGIAILNDDSEVIDLTYCDLRKTRDFWEKIDIVEKKFTAMSSHHDVTKIYVEENLQRFRPGLSSAKTIVTLAKMNGIVSSIARRIFKARPIDVNVNSARKVLGITINRKSKVNTKQQVFDQISERIKFDWPKKVLKSGPRKGKQVVNNVSYDMVDALVICQAGILLDIP
jgi:hypothetical protein